MLAGPARQAVALYILGDLFEVWIGDDAGLAEFSPERSCLRALTAAGVPVYFQHGNRDFLVGAEFAAATGVQLLGDPVRVDLFGTPTLLSHGDAFCTDDIGYQRWRRISRTRTLQAGYRALPRTWRERIASGIRARSDSGKQMKSSAIMDVNPDAVREAFRANGVRRLIHGHTHRPAEHDYDVDGARCTRHVLADWHEGSCEGLRVDASGVTRLKLEG